jgi:hypothetical protein
MDERMRLFDILYALAARDGREAALFGDSLPLAREAFARSLACGDFPEVWFELPLAGEPWFDAHLLTSRESVRPGMEFPVESTGGQLGAFEWFARQDGVRQLALSWDTGKGNLETPAVQVLVRGDNPEVSCSFLRAAGRGDLQGSYRSFAGRIPETWFACYTGVFPSRGRDSVRVECTVDSQAQRAYAQDADLLETHLRQAGIGELGETAIPRCQAMARTPFRLEFQFDVMPDGALGPTFGASVRFACPPGEGDWLPFDVNGAAGELMGLVASWGLADDRWRLLAGTAFAKRVRRGGDARVLSCYPAFVKLRWRGGEPLDAKAYLLAGVQG